MRSTRVRRSSTFSSTSTRPSTTRSARKALAKDFKAIDTRIKGAQFSEHLPLVAEQADKLAVIRSMTTKEGNHDRAAYLMHTGYAPSTTLQHPSLGAWVSHELGDDAAELPNFVSIRGASISRPARPDR